MSKSLPPLNTSQNHNNSYTAGTSAAYGGGQNTGRSYNSSTTRTMGPMRTVPKLPQIDFTLGPLQDRTLPAYNDLEDPHLYPYWRRQEMLAYERQARREEQIRRERQEARQREASRRRFNERRRREREELASKKGVRSTSSNDKAGAETTRRSTSRKAKTAKSSRAASERRRSSNQYPTEADQYGEGNAAAREPSTTDSDDDYLSRREEDALWEHIETFMDPNPAGVPLRDLPLMTNDNFVDLAKEHKKLSALDAKPTTRLDDLEYEMSVCAEKLAEEQKWADRETFLGTAVNGIPLRDLPLDDNDEFVELERTRRDLHNQSSPSRRQRIATVEGRMQEICRDCAVTQQHGSGTYPTEDAHEHEDDRSSTAASESESESEKGTHDEDEDKDDAAAAASLHGSETDLWTDREEYLGAYPEGVALRDIPLDSNEQFTSLEAERRHLLRDGGRSEHGAAIDKMEDRLRAICEESARAVKAEREETTSDVKNRYDDDEFEADEDENADNEDHEAWAELGDDDEKEKSASQKDAADNATPASSKRSSVNPADDKWAELGDDDEKEKSASQKDAADNATPASSKRSSVNPADDKWAELGDDDEKEKSASASAKPLAATETEYPVEKDAYDDEDFEDADDEADKKSEASAEEKQKEEEEEEEPTAHTTRELDAWAELHEARDDVSATAATPSSGRLFAAEEQAPRGTDDYNDDDFEDDDDDADTDEDKKSSAAVSSKRSSSINPHDSKWDELGDDDDDMPKEAADVEDKKSSTAVSSKRSSVEESAKSATPVSSHRTSDSEVKDAAEVQDKWAELGDDDDEDDEAGKKSDSSVVDDADATKSSGASTPVSSNTEKVAEDDYGNDDDWDEM